MDSTPSTNNKIGQPDSAFRSEADTRLVGTAKPSSKLLHIDGKGTTWEMEGCELIAKEVGVANIILSLHIVRVCFHLLQTPLQSVTLDPSENPLCNPQHSHSLLSSF